jgi:nicotinamide riboside kinase
MRDEGQRLTSLVRTSVVQARGSTALSLQVYADHRTMPSQVWATLLRPVIRSMIARHSFGLLVLLPNLTANIADGGSRQYCTHILNLASFARNLSGPNYAERFGYMSLSCLPKMTALGIVRRSA